MYIYTNRNNQHKKVGGIKTKMEHMSYYCKLKVIYVNARSLLNKLAEMQYVATQENSTLV